MTFVVVLQADYAGTYFHVFGGVHGPYETEAEAVATLEQEGYRLDRGEWSKNGVANSPETASIIQLTPLDA